MQFSLQQPQTVKQIKCKSRWHPSSPYGWQPPTSPLRINCEFYNQAELQSQNSEMVQAL